MRHNKWMIWVVVALAIVLCATLAACNIPTEPNGGNSSGQDDTPPQQDPPDIDSGDTSVDASLAIPAGLAAQDGTATWEDVAQATGYELEVNGTVVARPTLRYNLLGFEPLPKDGVFVLRVRSVKDSVHSAWSARVTYQYRGSALMAPTVEGMSGTVLQWRKVANASNPRITVNGTATDLAADATSFDLNGMSGDISLQYIGDGVYYLDSPVVRLAYNASAKKPLAWGAPVNVHMEGDVLHFDQVYGANIYYFMDIYNTVTFIKGEEINALQSDRTGKFLVKSMWAGNTEMSLAESAPTDVVYFDDSQGKGTAEEPYLIQSANDLRYIEYYEATNQTKYYRLANDVEFEPYLPKDDEEYSNFYNLGSLSGTLDGDGHTIDNIVVYYKDGYSSIFDTITESGKICNLKIENNKWRTWTNRTNDGIMHEKGGECAILAYQNYGTIDNVQLVSGSVTAARDGAGGLVTINYGTVSNCVVQQGFAVKGVNEVGSMVVYNDGTVTHCLNYGSVTGGNTVGGIVGRNAGKVVNCGNQGVVTGAMCVGGIVGYNYNVRDIDNTMQYTTYVRACYNRGTVSGVSVVGGIVGRNGSSGVNELGYESIANAGVEGCYNRGRVSGLSTVAGIAGENHADSTAVAIGHEGIKACVETGIVDLGLDGVQQGRLYLSLSACRWAEDGGADIRAYYWRKNNGTDQSAAAWPGVSMKKDTVGTQTLYYVDLAQGWDANSVYGVIFCRVNPTDDSEVYNQTEDIVIGAANRANGSVVCAINASFSNVLEASAASIAPNDNMVSDCYYVAGRVMESTGMALRATLGSATGIEAINSESNKQDIVDNRLNPALGQAVFVVVNNEYPTLAWEQ